MFSEEILSRSFIETDRGNPHRDRHRQIRRAHPEVRKLYGVNRNTAGLGLALVVAQVAQAEAAAPLVAVRPTAGPSPSVALVVSLAQVVQAETAAPLVAVRSPKTA